MTRRIMITGARGFIGAHLVKYLQEQTKDVILPISTISPDGWYQDLSNSETVRTIIKANKPDVIVHLAAQASPQLDSDYPSKIITSNIQTTQNLCHYAPRGARFVFASSVVVHGDTYLQPTSIYGITKRSAEQIIDYYTQAGHINGVSLRLCATVGRGLTHGVLKHWLVKIRSDSSTFDVFGDMPGSTKPYMHVTDVVRLFKAAIENNVSGSIECCNYDNISIKKMADILMDEVGIHKPLKWLGETANWPGDNKVIIPRSQVFAALRLVLIHPSSDIAIRQAIKDCL